MEGNRDEEAETLLNFEGAETEESAEKEKDKDDSNGTLLEIKAGESSEEKITILGTPEKSSLDLPTQIKTSDGKDQDDSDDSALVAMGSIFDKYFENSRQLTRGGMGEICIIKDKAKRNDAILKKMLPAAKEHVGRFTREAQITGQLEHPNIPPVYVIGKVKGENFYTQKQVKGWNLEEIIEKIDNKDPEFFDYNENRLIDDFLKICEALEYAHFKGVIHRDLKPANIMIGEFGEAYLMDWGLAKVLGHEDDVENNLEIEKEVSEEKEKKSLIGSISRRFFKSGERKTQRKTRDKTRIKVTDNYEKTMTGAAGTPGYMAPEQIDDAKNVDARADVFAMGAILYKILTFEDAFEGETAFNKFASTYSKDPVPVTKRWAWQSKPNKILESIVNKALAKDPEDRYPNMKGLISDIRAYKNHELVEAYDYGITGKVKEWNKRWKNIPLILLLTLGPVIGVAGSLVGYSANKARVAAEGRELAMEARVRRSEADDLVASGIDEEIKYNYDRAFQLYNEAIEKDPSYAKGWINRGLIVRDHYKKLEEFEKLTNSDSTMAFEEAMGRSEKDFLMAFETDNKDDNFSLEGMAEKNLADVYLKLARSKKDEETAEDLFEKAKLWYDKAVEKKHPESYFRRGIYFVNMEQWESAIADFSERIRLTPNDGAGYGLRGYCFFKKFESILEDKRSDYSFLEKAIRDMENAKEKGYDKMNPVLEKARTIMSERE